MVAPERRSFTLALLVLRHVIRYIHVAHPSGALFSASNSAIHAELSCVLSGVALAKPEASGEAGCLRSRTQYPDLP